MSKKKQPKIKLNLVTPSHSSGRGVGFYASNLKKSLLETGYVQLEENNPSITHYTFFDLFYSTLPLIKPQNTIVTVHDLSPLVLSNKYPKGIKGSVSLLRQRLSLINVRLIITDSYSSAKDIHKIFKISAKKISVVYISYDPIFNQGLSIKKIKQVKAKYNLPDKFVLNVSGGPNPNKNLVMLAKATKKVNIPLVIVGKDMLQKINYPVHSELLDLQALKEFDHIIYSGFVSTEELLGFYKLASVYCQSSLYEGFGIPLLEAQASECLLVSSNSSSLPEIYSKNTINFTPDRADNIVRALQKALHLSSIKKNKLIKEAKSKASGFSWDKTANETLRLYRDILSKP